MSEMKSLAHKILLADDSASDYPVTCIAGWKPSKDELKDMGYPSLPGLPPGKSYLIGADLLEWQHSKCASQGLYIVGDADKLFDLPEKCFEKPVAAYRPDGAQIYMAGFAAVVNQQQPSPDQTVVRSSNSVVAPDRHEDKESLSLSVYLGGEKMRAGDINRAFDLLGWQNSVSPCVCGHAYPNNCAHYLSNALIRAGFSEPSGGSNEKCSRGRLIRALDVLEWCKVNKREFSSDHNSISSGTWIVFQQRSGGVQHVCIHKERAGDYSRAGTGDYPDWPTQWHYRF